MAQTHPDARRIAQSLTRTGIAGKSVMHNAMREAEIERNAALIADLAKATGLSLAELAESVAAHAPALEAAEAA